MVALRKPKPDPEAIYEPVQPYSGPHGVWNPGNRLRGDHVAVRANFGAWLLADLPDDQKGRIRAEAIYGQTIAEMPKTPPPPVAEPPSGKFRAVRTWLLADPDLQHVGRIRAGQIVDADDPVFCRYPHLFVAHVEERGR